MWGVNFCGLAGDGVKSMPGDDGGGGDETGDALAPHGGDGAGVPPAAPRAELLLAVGEANTASYERLVAQGQQAMLPTWLAVHRVKVKCVEVLAQRARGNGDVYERDSFIAVDKVGRMQLTDERSRLLDKDAFALIPSARAAGT